MNRKSVATVVCGILLISIACASNISKKTMSAGERLYRARCRSCHTLIRPDKYSDSHWELMVEKYGQNINLTEQEKKQILQYLWQNN